MGVVVVGLARRTHRQLRVEARLPIDLRHPIDLLHQRRRQGQQVVGLFCTGLVGDLNGDLVLRFLRFQFIGLVVNRHRHIGLWQRLVDHAVAVALHRFCRGQRLNVGAEEAVAPISVLFIVHQCAVFKLRLPVAVMGQVFQLGIGVQRQAQTFHQVVGIGIAVLSGEGFRIEQRIHIRGVQVLIAYLFTDGSVRVFRFAEIIDMFHYGFGAVFTSCSIR